MDAPDNPLLQYFLSEPERPIHKWIHYFDAYHRLLAPYRGRELTFLEIGVQNGGSAMMWRDYLGPGARIIGVDVDPACKALEADGFEVWIGDQGDPAFWREFVQAHPKLDVILDDGGHTMDQQITTLNALWRTLADGGLFIFEDVHTSYFPPWGGGGPRAPGTFIGRIKRMIDDMHAWYHAPLDAVPGVVAANEISSIFVFDSLVGIHKQRRTEPRSLARGRPGGHVVNPDAMTATSLRRVSGVPDEGLPPGG